MEKQSQNRKKPEEYWCLYGPNLVKHMQQMFLENNLSENDQIFLQDLKVNLSDLSKEKPEEQPEDEYAIDRSRAVERLNGIRNKIDKKIWDKWVRRNAQKTKDQNRSRVDINKATLEKLKTFDERYNTKSKASFLDMLGTELEVCDAKLVHEVARLLKPFVKKSHSDESLSVKHLEALYLIFRGLESHYINSRAKLTYWSKGGDIDHNSTYRFGEPKPIEDGVTKTVDATYKPVLDGQVITVVGKDEQ